MQSLERGEGERVRISRLRLFSKRVLVANGVLYSYPRGAGSYAVTLFWVRLKLNFQLMNVKVHLLQTTVDEESDCVKVRWRVSGLSNKSFFGVLKSWRKPKDTKKNIRDYIE